MRKATRSTAWVLLAVSAAGSLTALAAPAANKANLHAVDGPGLKKAIEANRGKVVVLNLWATWCPPCVEEFPALVKLHDTYKAKGLTVIGASLDEPGDRSRVTEFLTKQKAKFPVYMPKGGDPGVFVKPIDKDWTGAVPTTYLYDRSGKRFGAPIAGMRSYAQFEAAIKQLLK